MGEDSDNKQLNSGRSRISVNPVRDETQAWFTSKIRSSRDHVKPTLDLSKNKHGSGIVPRTVIVREVCTHSLLTCGYTCQSNPPPH